MAIIDPAEDYDQRMRAIVAARREHNSAVPQKVEDEIEAGEIETSGDEWIS